MGEGEASQRHEQAARGGSPWPRPGYRPRLWGYMSQRGILLLQPASPRARRAGACGGIPDGVGAGRGGGRVASAVSAVTHAHAGHDAPGASPGLCLGQPSTGSHRRQGGDARLSPAAGTALLRGRAGKLQRLLLGAAASASQVAAVQGLVQERAGQGRKRLWAHLCKRHPSWSRPLAQTLPFRCPAAASAALPTHRAQQPWHGHPAVAAGTASRVCHSPFALARRPNTSLQGSWHEVTGPAARSVPRRPEPGQQRSRRQLQNKLTL